MKKEFRVNRFRVWSLFVSTICIISFQSCTSTKWAKAEGDLVYEWQIVKKEKSQAPSWIVYAKKIKDTPFLAYKIEGEIAATPIACRDTFIAEIHHLASGANNKKYPTYDLLEVSPNSLLTYVIHNEPFPLKNTEMSVRYQIHEQVDGNAGVSWKEAWEETLLPPSKRFNRVETFRGSWDFSPTSSNHSNAMNVVSFDPKKMPLWFAQPMVIKFLKNGLKDLREKMATSRH